MPHLYRYKTTRQDKGACCNLPPEKHCLCTRYYRSRVIEYLPYNEWLPNLRMAAPDVPDNILLDAVRRGAIEFCKQSHFLLRQVQLPLQDCVGDFYLCLGEEERLDGIRVLSVNGQCYRPVGERCDLAGLDAVYWYYPPATLEIHPAPRACDQVTLLVEAVPKEDSSYVDRLIYDRYFEAPEYYALARVAMMPYGKLYSPEVERLRKRQFRMVVNQAKIDQCEHFASARREGGHCD